MKHTILSLIAAFGVLTAQGQSTYLVNNTAMPVTFQTAEPGGVGWLAIFSATITVNPGETKGVYQSWWPFEETSIINGGQMLTSVWGTMYQNIYYTNYLSNNQRIAIKSSAGLSDYESYVGCLYGYTTLTLGAILAPPVNTNACGLSAPTCGGSIPCSGMAGYSFNSLQTALHIQDTPLVYAPPVGPSIAFIVAYNQRDGGSTNILYSNVGPSWNLSAISFIEDDPNRATNDVRCVLPGGGAESYTGFNTNTSQFQIQPSSQTTLTTYPTGYARLFPDGSKSVYDYPSTTTNLPRRVFLTRDIDVAGNEVHYNYETLLDGRVRLMSVVDTLHQTNTFSYAMTNDVLKVTAICDPFGHSAQFGYAFTNGASRLTGVTDPELIVSQFQYGTNNFINALVTPYGTTSFATSDDGSTRTIQATDPYGQAERLESRAFATLAGDSATPSGMIASTSDSGVNNSYFWSKKAWTQYSNDVSQAEVTHWGIKRGALQAYPLWTKKPLENRVWFNYPGQTSGFGAGITTERPSTVGRVMDNGSTQKATLTFDSFGNVTNSVDAVGRTTRFIYSTNGIDLIEAYQKNGTNWDLLANIAYNAQHLPTSATIEGVPSTFGYSTNGLLLKSTNAIGQILTYNYDVQGFLTNIAGQLPTDTVDISYDSAGRLLSLRNGEGYAITNAYDGLNRLTNSAFPDGTSIRSVFQSLDVARTMGRDNRWTYQTHDANRKLTDVQDQAGRIFHYEWCGCGALESLTDPKGQMTLWSRDVQNRPTQKIYADLAGDSISYEAKTSRVKSTTDAVGKSVSIAYANDNNVTNISYSGGTVTPGVSFTFDTNYNRMTKMVDGIGTNAMTYVPTGQPAAGSVQTVDGPLVNDTITFGYDAVGRPLTLQIGTASSSVQYDTVGRVWWSSNLLGVTTIEYVGATGRPDKVTRPNGLTCVFGYTASSEGSQLKSLVTTNEAGQVVESYGYSYDIRNLITTQTNAADGITIVWTYDYDLAQQLIGAVKATNGVVSSRYLYSYDKAGNRTSAQVNTTAATGQVNSLNQLQGISGGGTVRVSGYLNEAGSVSIAGAHARMTSLTNFVGEVIVGVGSYNIPVIATDLNNNSAATNIIQTFTASGLNTTLSYDKAGNLLVKANTAKTNTFGWDGIDRCTGITNGVLRTCLAYDGLNRWMRITEFSGTNSTSDRRFVWNGNSLAEERDATGTNIVQRFFANGFQRGGTNYYYSKDHLGSVVAVSLQNGTVVARFEYDPYGVRKQTFGTIWVDFGYAGLFELSNGLNLAIWRLYDPTTGRWLSRDPMGENGGWNLYAYCGSDPVNGVDFSGLARISAGETLRMIHDSRDEILSLPKFSQRLIRAFQNHTRGGRYDFKWTHPNDEFCVNGQWLRADQFGNYMAGYVGQLLGRNLSLRENVEWLGLTQVAGNILVRVAGGGVEVGANIYTMFSPWKNSTKVEILTRAEAATKLVAHLPFLGDDMGSIENIGQGQFDSILNK